MKEINFFEFEEQYKPIKNHIDDNASYNGYMFETYGAEYDHVLSVYEKNPDCVWTVLADSGNVEVTSGVHWINRLGYIITENPVDDDFVDVIDEDYEEPELSIEEKRDAVIDDWFDTCLNDSGFLKSLLQEMIGDKSEEEIAKLYDDAFGDQ